MPSPRHTMEQNLMSCLEPPMFPSTFNPNAVVIQIMSQIWTDAPWGTMLQVTPAKQYSCAPFFADIIYMGLRDILLG